MLLKKVVNTVVKTGLSLSLAFTMTVQADNNKALDSFLGKLKQLQNMQADFVQVMRDGKKRELQRWSGKIMIELSGKLYWQTNPPYVQLVVSVGTALCIYDMDLH